MEKIEPKHAEVMIMSVLKGMTTKVISEVLGKPQNTILTWLSKAKIDFHDCIEGHVTMPASKIKITKNDILLFLANELEGEKAVYISNVDEKLAGELNSVVDKEIKETLAKYRRVDSVLSNAADTSLKCQLPRK